MIKTILGCLSIAAFSSQAFANEFILDQGGLEKGAHAANAIVGFVGSGNVSDAQVDLTYDANLIEVTQVKAMNGAGCSNLRQKGFVRIVSPDLGGKDLASKVTPYCQVSFKALKGALPANALKLDNSICSGLSSSSTSCSASDEHEVHQN